MADYVIVSGRLRGFKPGDVVSDADLLAAGIIPAKNLVLGSIKEKQNTKASRKYAKPIEEETE